MIDLILLAVCVALGYVVAGEGAWGAGLTLLSVIFAGLLAMNFFEPVANFLSDQMPSYAAYWDFVSLVGLFALFVFLLRLGTDNISPVMLELNGNLYLAVRWALGLFTGYVTMAFLLTALHTAPLPREFLGFTPERRNLFSAAAPDRQWLGFVQYVSEKSMRQGARGRIFDGPRYPAPGMQPKPPGQDENMWSSFPIRYATRRDDMGGKRPRQPGPVAPVPGGGGAAF